MRHSRPSAPHVQHRTFIEEMGETAAASVMLYGAVRLTGYDGAQASVALRGGRG